MKKTIIIPILLIFFLVLTGCSKMPVDQFIDSESSQQTKTDTEKQEIIKTTLSTEITPTKSKEEQDYIQDHCISITNFHFNAVGNDNYNLNDEYVTFKNKCSYPIDMGGWSIKDETASHIYTIPSFTFQSGATFTLYTGTGTNTNSALYWKRTSRAIWNNDGDTLFLRDSSGKLVLNQRYAGY